MAPSPDNLIWVDLEMTGLDVATKAIIEVAVIVTDANLKELGRWPEGRSGQAIFQPPEVIANADKWVRENLSGLLERVKTSPVTLAAAEEQVLALIARFCPPPSKTEKGCPLAGNSIGQDRAFLRAYMPRVAAHTSYRNVDVSTIKELVKRWYPESLHFDKDAWLTAHFPGGKHNAMVDLAASIAELEFYRDKIFRRPE